MDATYFNPEAAMDVRFDLRDFNSTTCVATALSEAGLSLFAQMFGAGCVSVELPKSRGEDFLRFVQQRGLLTI